MYLTGYGYRELDKKCTREREKKKKRNWWSG
jgi:hypothetical protein